MNAAISITGGVLALFSSLCIGILKQDSIIILGRKYNYKDITEATGDSIIKVNTKEGAFYLCFLHSNLKVLKYKIAESHD